MTGREPAWRVFANELSTALEQEKGSGERATSYLLSPLGARMNRVLMVGRLSAAESVGRNESQPFLRARLTDPTGTTTVTAGSFQPRALAQLRAGAGGTGPMLVVGKSHLYQGRDGVGYTSVRAEAIRKITEAEYRLALGEAARQTLDRVDLGELVRSSPSLADNALAEHGYPALWVHGAREAARRYPTIRPAEFRAPLGPVLDAISGEASLAATPPPSPGAAPVARVLRDAPAPTRPPVAPGEHAQEAILLEILDALAERSGDGYADLREATRDAGARGLSAETLETILDRLEEEGVLVEPIVGKLRRS